MTVQPTDATRSSLLALLEAVTPAAARLRHATAYFDAERDKALTQVAAFAPAVASLEADPAFAAPFGATNLQRLAIQFAYHTFSLLDTYGSLGGAFDAVWAALVAEAKDPVWRFAAVANLNNFAYGSDVADLGHGVSVQGRLFDRLRAELRWDQYDLDRLSEDWSAGGGASSHVLVVVTSQPKTPDNFLLSSDGAYYQLAARALLGMRLHGPGDLHIGRFFVSRPASFNVGIGGRTTAGLTIWRPGKPYALTDAMLPAIRAQVDVLAAVEGSLQTNARHVALALRSFSSTYDRLMHQADDSIIDAITALEAVWKLDAELSFRLAFRTSSLFGVSDNHREALFETLRTYYRLRSKLVHGGNLTDKEQAQARDVEQLRQIVRDVLRAFIHLLAQPGEWTLSRLAGDPDRDLLHSERRTSLQKAMAIGGAPG